MKNVVIILPTFNEKDNIGLLLKAIQYQKRFLNGIDLSVLVVDDSSPDGTGQLVQEFTKHHSDIHLLNGSKKQGLGVAYIRGIKHAINEMGADVVFEMDADFSHNPNDIPRLLTEVSNGSDFVIGSRYISGGSTPNNWSWLRKATSKWGNLFSRYVAGLDRVRDCTSGYRAIKTEVLKKIDLDKLGVKGYAFQISLLHQAIKSGARVSEIPIQFTDRVYGESKLGMADIIEFVLSSFQIRFPFVKPFIYFLLLSLFGLSLVVLTGSLVSSGILSAQILLVTFVTLLSIILTSHGIFTLVWMLYAWEDPENAERHKSPKELVPPKFSFTALIPARHEGAVIKDTIETVSAINYPNSLKETLILCREDDTETIAKAQETIARLGQKNIRLVTFNSFPINKPHSLNQGLKEANNEIIAIFDAEDEPSPAIYNIINTVLLQEKTDIVQSGVQLMNYRSHWFSTLNVMEYYFWFKSALHFFTRVGGVSPLGGNTVFFKKGWLEKIGGWDENSLTEDADIGFRLASAGAGVKVVYDEQYVTKEETPPNLASFIRQRTRWNQGFLQIFLKGDWKRLPTLRQRLFAVYTLLSPGIQTVLLLYLPIAIWVVFTQKLPIIVSLFSFIPLLLLLLQIVVFVVGLYEFTKAYNLKFPFWMPLKIIFTFYPFQLLLMVSSLRAFYRIAFSYNGWEKTAHTNAHRKMVLEPWIIQDAN